MVFKHNKQRFAGDDSCQFSYKHQRQLDCGGQLASFAEHSSFSDIPQKHPISDVEREGIFSQSRGNVRLGGDVDNLFSVVTHKEFENKVDGIPGATAASAVGDAFSLSWATSSITEVVRSEHSKRPFSDDSSCEVAVKRTRQADQDSQADSCTEFASFNSNFEALPTSVAPSEELEKGESAAISEDPARNAPSSILSLPGFTRSTTEENTRLEPPVRLSFFPGYFEDDHQTTGFNQPEEIYSPVYEYLPRPRKPVAIGPDHQADVPGWRSQCSKNPFGESDDCVSFLTSVTCPAGPHLIDEDNSVICMEGSVMSMPDFKSRVFEPRVRNCKTRCSCTDEGSIRCVREHVMEAREKLRKKLGPDRFIQLGFYDMGEDVAHHWTEEEEQLFLDVVLSNPASMGKNFWDKLPQVFPSRCSKELVSYYFNVFMLRKRAGQNRSDPLNVDSDDDEWQDSDDGEFATTEEDDEDSVVESDRDDVTCYNGHTEVDTEDENGYDCAIGVEELYDFSKGCIIDKSRSVRNVQPMGKNLQDGGEDKDVQDDSCTSYEGQQQGFDPCDGPVDFVERLEPQDSLVGPGEYGNDALCAVTDQEYIVGHCDPRTWELDYMRGAGREIDFSPTCNVIEEVFGKGSWENGARDSHGIV